MEGLRGSDTAVYVGNMAREYANSLIRDLDTITPYAATGTAVFMMSDRILYFDWHDPSISIDTACSSGLVGVHLAVQALRSGDSHLAVVCESN